MRFFLFFGAFFFLSTSFAATYAKCGKTANPETFEVTGYELELSSETDSYRGPVSEEWNLKLGSEDSAWLEYDRSIVARTFESEADTVVEINLRNEGIRYRLIGLYDEEPVLEKTVPESDEIETFQCISGND